MKSANFSNEILEIRDEPRSVFFDFGPDLIASESDEGVGGRTGLQVGGTVADHYQLLETMRVLQASNHASFSTRLRGQLYRETEVMKKEACDATSADHQVRTNQSQSLPRSYQKQRNSHHRKRTTWG